jgi:hypothetical protein
MLNAFERRTETARHTAPSSDTEHAPCPAAVLRELAMNPSVALELYFLSRDERLRELMWNVASLSHTQFNAVQLLVGELLGKSAPQGFCNPTLPNPHLA